MINPRASAVMIASAAERTIASSVPDPSKLRPISIQQPYTPPQHHNHKIGSDLPAHNGTYGRPGTLVGW